MSTLTKSYIPYLTHNWPVVTGCTPCSPACENCWSAAQHKRFHPGEAWVPSVHPERLSAPANRKMPAVIGVAFTGDLFHADVPNEFLDDVFSMISRCPQHQFVILTKRPERLLRYLQSCERGAGETGRAWPWPNVLYGCTVWDQPSLDAAAPYLKELHALGCRIWISYEPALGPIEISPALRSRLSWVVCGCEQLPGGRPGREAQGADVWMSLVHSTCFMSGVPCFIKQGYNPWNPRRVAHSTVIPEGIPRMTRLSLPRLPVELLSIMAPCENQEGEE